MAALLLHRYIRPMASPLAGIKVIDMTRVMSGPLSTVLLADMGADVIKIEAADGDITRHTGGHMRNGVTAMFLALNRGKKSFTVDLRSTEGREAVAKLAATSDVFVENFRPGVAEAMGLGAENLRGANPRLIYLSINGFGRDGAMVDEPAYDTVIQAQTGMISRQKGPDGGVDRVRSFPVDKLSGMFATQAILAALFHRERTGEGATIDVPMFDATMYHLWIDVLAEMSFADGQYTKVADTWRGRNVTATADGHIMPMAVSLKEIHGSMRAIGRPDLTTDDRFTSIGAYMKNIREHDEIMAAAYAQFATDEIVQRLEAEGVAVSRVLSAADVVADERLTGGDFFMHWDHPTAGAVRQARPPIRFDRERQTPNLSSPEIGEHTAEILADLGYSPEQIQTMTTRA